MGLAYSLFNINDYIYLTTDSKKYKKYFESNAYYSTIKPFSFRAVMQEIFNIFEKKCYTKQIGFYILDELGDSDV